VRAPRRTSDSNSIISREETTTEKGQQAHEKDEKVQLAQAHAPALTYGKVLSRLASEVPGCF